ncbi:MAG TPA: acyl-CoA thioester hydrolase/BAAT C-terminal domain-containing protein [Allosphingosinicella sp.]|nr:acyl-CoA thioester hydrolase/BAAT C-terminal domain-containing protein [Allosphingosinicella sp.]
MSFVRFAIVLATICIAAAPAAAATLSVRPVYRPGETADLIVNGLRPGERIRIHSWRRFSRSERDPATGQWSMRLRVMHGWADFRADRRGTVAVERARPLAGTYPMADGLGLFWSMRLADDPVVRDAATAAATPAETALEERRVDFRAQRGNGETLAAALAFAPMRPGTFLARVQRPGLVGVFAAPPGARALPTLIFMHGSEGADVGRAREAALGFAEQGFTTLALLYHRRPWQQATEGVADFHTNTPVEMLQQARDWLATRPEADADRIGLIGNSKGAEFAMVGAATYDWVRAAVGCVPSDVVWEGDTAHAPAGQASSWSRADTPLPYVPLHPWVDADGDFRPDNFFDNTERYVRSRRDRPREAAAARIPVERSRARLLLLGGDRDEVWASGAMSRAIVTTMRRAGRGGQAEALTFPRAGHQICGDGTFPVHAYEIQSTRPRDKILTDEGHANAIAFRRKIAFLHEALAPRR